MTAAATTARSSVAEAVERLIDARVEQGLGRVVTDPAAVARIAAEVRGTKR